MKNFKLFVFSIIVALFMTTNVNADEVDTVSKLQDCISVDKSTCTLTDNIDVGEFTGAKFTVDLGKTITIDLNGYTLSGKNSDEKVSTSIITNKGTLIINDSSTTKAGKIEMSDTNVRLYAWAYGMFTINNTGDLTINGGSIINNGKTDVAYAVDNNSTSYNVKLTVNDGTLKGIAAVRAFANSTTKNNDIIINGGHLEGTSAGIWLQQSNANAQKASLVVNDGVIIGGGYPGVYADINNDKGSEVISMTFNGGEIRNNSEKYGAISFLPVSGDTLSNAVINLKITDALVINENANSSALYFDSVDEINTDNIKITGGTYSKDVKEYIATGLVSKKIGDNYVVGKEYEIKLPTVSNGKIELNTTKAIKGEVIEFVITPDDGYELSLFKVEDSAKEILEVSANKFTMPNSDVTITLELVKVTTKTDVPVLDTNEEVEEVVVGVKEDEEVTDVLLDSLTKDTKLQEKIKNTSVNVSVEIDKVDVNELPTETKKAIEEKAGNAKVATYFDISVVVKNAKDNTEIDKISELTKKIELMILLPKELKNTNSDVNRKYFVIREHINEEGIAEVEVLEAKLSEDGNYLIFESDSFSTYALAYEDSQVEKEEDKDTDIKDDENKDDTNKDETSKDEGNKDESNTEDEKQDETNKEDSKEDEKQEDVNKEDEKQDETNKEDEKQEDKDNNIKDEENKEENNDTEKEEDKKDDKEEVKEEGKEEKPSTSNPQTGDNLFLYVILGFISLIAFSSVGLYLKKRFD